MVEPEDDPEQTLTEAVPPDPVTRPDAVRVRCPECAGERYVLKCDEWDTRHKALAAPCPLCHAQGHVDRKTFTAWHQKRMGRPRADGG